MTFALESEHRSFLNRHTWAILATGRRDGSPQQSMVGYVVDADGRILVSAKDYTSKWKNAARNPRVCLTVPDGRVHLVLYGVAEGIAEDPLRAELTAAVYARLSGKEVPDPTKLTPRLDQEHRTILRIDVTKSIFHE